MKHAKTTKRALLSSVLALVLCFSMLVGTTFAWFTDSVTSANNIIVAGNLDVELEYSTDMVNWAPVTATTNIFDAQALWEPGYTEVVYLRVSNVGSLALKYQLGINVASEIAGKTKEGAEFKLSDYIEYGVLENVTAKYADRDAARGAVSAADKLNTAYEKQFALVGQTETAIDTDVFALVVYMPETVGNEVNHNGTNIPVINLGLTVLATQMANEEDSFGNDYDEGAVYYDVLVSSAEELYDAVAAATGDIVIAVDGNVKLTKALSKSGLKNVTFVAWDEDATIDQAKYNMHFSGAKVTFRGLNLTHEDKAYGDGGQTSTAFAVWEAAEVSYVDCTFDRSVGTIHASVHNFIRCTFNGVENPDNSKSEYPLYICSGEEYNVVDCVFNCTNRGAILFYNDGGSGVDTLNISGTKFLGDIIADKAAVEIHNAATTQTYNVNINNVEVGDGVINGLYRIKPANVGEVNVNVNGVKAVATASTASKLSSAIANAQAGDTIYLNTSVDVGGTQLALNKEVTLDLNGQTLTTQNNYGGMTLTNGASIQNGVINHPGNTAAIKVSGNAGSIENVTINITPTAGKTKTGIQVYNGKYVEAIKNVTITGVTQGIEVAKGSRVDLIENVTVEAVADGAKKGVALLVNAASVGKAVNCSFSGDYGVYMMLNGEFIVALELENCSVTGSTAALIAHDEVGIANVTNCSLTLTYDANTVLNGEFVWSCEEECLGVVTQPNCKFIKQKSPRKGAFFVVNRFPSLLPR